MEKGYARKCDGKGPDGKTWYVPHIGVLNNNKGCCFLLQFSI